VPERQKAKSWSCIFLLGVDLCTTAKGLWFYGGEQRCAAPRGRGRGHCQEMLEFSIIFPAGTARTTIGLATAAPAQPPDGFCISLLLRTLNKTQRLEAAGPVCFHLCTRRFN